MHGKDVTHLEVYCALHGCDLFSGFFLYCTCFLLCCLWICEVESCVSGWAVTMRSAVTEQESSCAITWFRMHSWENFPTYLSHLPTVVLCSSFSTLEAICAYTFLSQEHKRFLQVPWKFGIGSTTLKNVLALTLLLHRWAFPITPQDFLQTYSSC